MKKTLLILMVELIAFVTLTSAQSDIDSFKVKLERLKKYQISDNLIKDKWINSVVGFNDQCDTIYFQGKHYDLLGFNFVFNKFISNRLKHDTIILQLDYGNNISLNKIYCSYDILANQIERYTEKGIYYFSIIHAQKETIIIKTDTIDLHINKTIEYNRKSLKYSELSKHLKISKPELVILRVDSDVLIQDLTDILKITKKLMIKTILEQ